MNKLAEMAYKMSDRALAGQIQAQERKLKAGKGDAAYLAELKDELGFREMPKAQAKAARVAKHEGKGPAKAEPPAPPKKGKKADKE